MAAVINCQIEILANNAVVGRTYRDAPEVDGFVRISYEGSPPPIGEFTYVEITGAHEYDLEGKPL